MRILEAALYVDDLDAARSFYEGIVGLDVLAEKDGRHVFYRCDDTVLLTFRADATEQPTPPNTLPVPSHGTRGPGHVCFGADGDAIDGWVRRFQTEGVEVEADFHWPNGARSIYVRDPSGNSVEFAETKLWGFA